MLSEEYSKVAQRCELFSIILKFHLSIIISVLPKGRSLTATQESRLQFSPKAAANLGTKVAVLPGIHRCGSFPLLSTPPRSLASEQTLKDLKRSQGH